MKKGFTLIELLAVIAIIGILAVMVLPGLVKNYEKSLIKTMKTQESQLKDAANLALQDYCNSPRGATSKEKYKTRQKCIYDKTNRPDGIARLYKDNQYYICISTLKGLEYYENELVYEKKQCSAFVFVDKNTENNMFKARKTYVYCGDFENADYVTGIDSKTPAEREEANNYFDIFVECQNDDRMTDTGTGVGIDVDEGEH